MPLMPPFATPSPPDIQYIALSCSNRNITPRYIDIVNEVLRTPPSAAIKRC